MRALRIEEVHAREFRSKRVAEGRIAYNEDRSTPVAAANAAEDLRSAEAALAAARDKLRVLGRSQEQVRRIEATRQVDVVVPVAPPIGGTVVQRRVGPGHLSTMWLVAAVRERDAP